MRRRRSSSGSSTPRCRSRSASASADGADTHTATHPKPDRRSCRRRLMGLKVTRISDPDDSDDSDKCPEKVTRLVELNEHVGIVMGDPASPPAAASLTFSLCLSSLSVSLPSS